MFHQIFHKTREAHICSALWLIEYMSFYLLGLVGCCFSMLFLFKNCEKWTIFFVKSDVEFESRHSRVTKSHSDQLYAKLFPQAGSNKNA